MICAIITRFDLFQISGFSIRELTRGISSANECARPMNSFCTTAPPGVFIGTIRQILDSFVRILNTRSAIMPLARHFTALHRIGKRRHRPAH
jgi:hypothetical protein